MQIIKFNQQYKQKIVLALGFFDCMHLGHRALLSECQKLAREYNCLSAIFTFDNNHMAVLGKDTKLIYTIKERLEIFSQQNADVVMTAHFDKQFMSLTAQQFFSILTDCYDIKAIVCGADYTCGSDVRGVDYIKHLCDSHSILLSVVGEVKTDGQKVSSTLVRKLLLANDIEKANELLSQPYSISGEVVHGRQVGREIGFPTANIAVDKDKLLPCGVFGGYSIFNEKQYLAIINIGTAPTFEFNKKLVEVHFIGFNANLYNSDVTVYVTKFIRNIVKFESVEQLKAQLDKDVEKIIND